MGWVFFTCKKDIVKNILDIKVVGYYQYILFFTIIHYGNGKTTKYSISYI